MSGKTNSHRGPLLSFLLHIQVYTSFVTSPSEKHDKEEFYVVHIDLSTCLQQGLYWGISCSLGSSWVS